MTTENTTPTPLIIDDDGSQDGMTAIAYMLANPQFDVQAITVSNGIARPEVFDDNVLRMLDRLDDSRYSRGCRTVQPFRRQITSFPTSFAMLRIPFGRRLFPYQKVSQRLKLKTQ